MDSEASPLGWTTTARHSRVLNRLVVSRLTKQEDPVGHPVVATLRPQFVLADSSVHGFGRGIDRNLFQALGTNAEHEVVNAGDFKKWLSRRHSAFVMPLTH